ncbi:hypothetical protein FB45DRAFT_916617 [Roridomyces roridus]|uniref:Uncharacterized protein n=1 Tax=Roridomyces roridus TaxID=1738132 RepID=A0AAD7BUK4_9AGAR|nr:hypothetical protein FB45DRAFT_916617 [Roridomyces roridus]
MTTVPAPSALHTEQWSDDADFDFDGQAIHAVADRDEDDNEDWDTEMQLGKTGQPSSAQVVSAPAASQMFIIRPPQQPLSEIDDDDDDETATLRPARPRSPIDEDFEDAFSLPSDLTQLSLAPVSLNHRWGDRDQTSSSQSSDAYSSLGFADASPSSNSTSSDEDDDDDDELEGISGKGARHLTKLLEMKKKAEVADNHLRDSNPDPEEDFESGLVIDDDHELSPSRLHRSNSAPVQRRASSSLRLSAKSPSQASLPPPAPSSFLSPKPGNLRGQKSHSGLKPPTPPSTTRKLTRKASLSNQASGSGSASTGSSRAGYEEPTAASRAKTYKYREYKVPPTRPSTPSTNPAALRLTMPTASRQKSRPALSSLFNAGPSSASGSQSPLFRSLSPLLMRPTQPVRLFGDGTELDGFDDLPTDRDKESRYRVQPKGYGNRVPGGSYPPKPDKGTMRRKRREGSEGGSLDAHSPLGSSTNTAKHATRADLSPRSIADPPRKKRANSSPSAQGKKKPTLIRNLGGSGAPRVVGDMRWNPQTLRWEGNEHVLRDFDAAVGTSTRPALITHLTGSSIGSPVGSFANGARIVGNMIFDPARMCWISTLPPDEDEPDVFANLADDEGDEEDSAWESKGGTIRASLQLVSSSSSTSATSTATLSAAPSPARSDSYVRAGSESDGERGSRGSMVFDVDESFLESCRVAEERHRLEMKGWNYSATPQDPFVEPDHSHLYEIRELATRKYT